MIKADQILTLVIAGVIAALVLERLRAPTPNVIALDAWLNPETGVWEAIATTNDAEDDALESFP